MPTDLKIINSLDCIVKRKNTGWANCAFLPGLVKMAIAVPYDFYIDGSSSPYAQLLAAMVNPVKSQRAFPIGMFIEFTDQSTQAGNQTFNYGGSLRTNDGVPKWMFQFANGKHCFYKKALTFDDSQDFFKWYFIDHKNQLMGVEDTITDDDGTYNIFRPFTQQEVAVQNWTPGTNSAVPKYTISFTFEDVSEYRENLGFIDLSKAVGASAGGKYTNLKGLQDVELSSEDIDDAVYGITALLNCSGQNLGEYFSSEFAAVGNWKAVNATTGNAVTISNVAWNGITGEFEVTLDAVDPDFTGNILISLAPPDHIWEDLGLLYESDSVQVAA